MNTAIPYLVVTDGNGEYDSDFGVQVRLAASAQEALDAALADGYGKERAYVVQLEHVNVYDITERNVKVTERTTFEKVVEAETPNCRPFLDPNNITGIAVPQPAPTLPPRARRVVRDSPQA